jgi:hypothetical protein
VPARGGAGSGTGAALEKSNAFGVDDALISVLFHARFLEWVSSAERYRVTFA